MGDDMVRVTLTYRTHDDMIVVLKRVVEALEAHGDAAYELIGVETSSFVVMEP